MTTTSTCLNQDPLLTVGEVADYLNVSVRFVWHEIKREQMPAVRLGRLVRVRRSALEQYIASNVSGELQRGGN